MHRRHYLRLLTWNCIGATRCLLRSRAACWLRTHKTEPKQLTNWLSTLAMLLGCQRWCWIQCWSFCAGCCQVVAIFVVEPKGLEQRVVFLGRRGRDAVVAVQAKRNTIEQEQQQKNTTTINNNGNNQLNQNENKQQTNQNNNQNNHPKNNQNNRHPPPPKKKKQC